MWSSTESRSEIIISESWQLTAQVVAETSKQFERTERNQAGVLYSIIK